MDILQFLKGKEPEKTQIAHPVACRSQTFKYYYCLGLGVMSMGNMKAIIETQSYFEQLLTIIGLSHDEYIRIVSDINNNFDGKLKEILHQFVEKQDKYVFLLDLQQLAGKALWAQDYCHQILLNFEQLMQLSSPELEFLHHFYEASVKKNGELARRCYEEIREEGYEVDYQILTYIYPGFSLEEEYGEMVLEPGNTLYIDKPTVIRGSVQVKKGASFIVHNTSLTVTGNIVIDGGRMEISSALVTAENVREDYLFLVKHTAVVLVENSTVDCGHYCGFLKQEKGQLLLKESRVSDVTGQPALTFKGKSGEISGCVFNDCAAGAVAIQGLARVHLAGCMFVNSRNDYGGGIYSESLEKVSIEDCEFQNCEAKYMGAAIYFKYEKFGQRVKRCRINGCMPEETAVFNSYEDDPDI